MFHDSRRMKMLHHCKVFAYVPALELAREERRHEPTDDVTAVPDHFSDDVILPFIISGRGNFMLLHDLQYVPAMIPLVLLDLTNGGYFF